MFKKNVIKNYCKKHGISIRVFSHRIHDFEKRRDKGKSIKLHMLYLYNQARRKPSFEVLEKLEQITNSEINYYSFTDQNVPIFVQSTSKLPNVDSPQEFPQTTLQEVSNE
jgi:hypothetical protein